MHGTSKVSETGALPEALGGVKVAIVPAGKLGGLVAVVVTARLAVPNAVIVTE